MENVTHKLVNSCKITTELIDKQQLTPLSLKEKLQLKAHKAMCNACNAYEKQSNLINIKIKSFFGDKPQSPKSKLSTDKKNEIINKIKKK